MKGDKVMVLFSDHKTTVTVFFMILFLSEIKCSKTSVWETYFLPIMRRSEDYSALLTTSLWVCRIRFTCVMSPL